MTKRIRILLIDANDESRNNLNAVLNEMPGVEIRQQDKWQERWDEIFVDFQPELAIINLVPDETKALDFAENLQKQYPQLMIIVTAPEMHPEAVRRAMRWGAREFLPQPFKPEEVNNAIREAIQFKESASKDVEHGEVICLFGAKGGSGTTTLAVNLSVAMAKLTKMRVILVDLHLQLGQVAIYLDVKSKYSILDVVNHLDGLDVQLFLKTLPQHASGVYVLPSPFRIEEVEFITASHIERLLAFLRRHFDYIILDTHPHLDEVTLKALDSADKILLISGLDLATIFNSKRYIELFFKLGYPQEKIVLVLNRYTSYSGADLDQMEKLLEYPIAARIALHDFDAMMNAINHGVPVIEKSPHAKMSEGIEKLVESLAGDQTNIEDKLVKGGLFAKFRKK